MEIAKKHKDRLKSIKQCVENSYNGWKHNYDRYNEFKKFVFQSSLTSDDANLLAALGLPQMEFNILEAYYSRMMGEFYKQEPSIIIESYDDKSVDLEMLQFIQDRVRYELLESDKWQTSYRIYKDVLNGWGVGKIWTDYSGPMSFQQEIFVDRVDPTLCGFDLMSKLPHKGDGRYCFELFPMTREEFENDYPGINTQTLKFTRNFEGFGWSYESPKHEIILVCDFYEKKKRKEKIVQLVNGQVMTEKNYEKMIEKWKSFELPPTVQGEPRWSTFESINRYRLIENEIIEFNKTDYTYLPLVFFDGNTIEIKNSDLAQGSKQFIRPLVYHAKDAQKLKNYSGIKLANEIENIVQHKFMVAKEALPKEMEWLEAYKDIQKPSTLVYNSFYDENSQQPIANPIQAIPRVGAPPEIMQAFTSADSLVQNILGSYDASLGINNNQLSGIAIVEAATQSNAATMPYFIGFLSGLTRVGEILVDLIPKYNTLPRVMAVMGSDREIQKIKVNQPGGMNIKYEPSNIKVKIEAGPSYQIQKNRALQQIIALMQASPSLAEFFNTDALPVLFDNIEIRGIDQLKQLYKDYQERQKQKQAIEMQQMQQNAQMNPIAMKNQLEMQKMQQNAQKNRSQFEIDMQKLKTDQMKALSDALISKQSNNVQMVKAATEKFAKEADIEIKRMESFHKLNGHY
jgi:hypothetical protein